MATELSDLAKMLAAEPVNKEEEQSEEETVEEGQENVEESVIEGDIEEPSDENVEENSQEDLDNTSDEEVEAYYPETFDDLVAAYDGDSEKLKSIKVASKKNGEQVTLGQVLANWEISEAATRKSQEASEALKALQTERQQFHSTLEKKYAEQDAIINALEELYMNAGKAELDMLRQEDPAEYAARKADFAEREKALQLVKQKIGENKETLTQEQKQTILQEQNALTAQLIPEWQDQNTANQEYAAIVSYLSGLGFQQEAISGITSAHWRKIVRDAALYNKMKTVSDPKKKRIVQKPKKGVRAGSASKHNMNEDAFEKRMKQAAQSDNMEVKRDAVTELLFRQRKK